MKELETDLPAKDRDDIGAAFREMLLNAIEHGGKSDPNQAIDVCYIRTDRLVLYQVRDSGKGFAMDSLPHAAISNPEDSPVQHALYRAEHGIRPGGFGILVTRGLVDELIYNEKGNEVTLIKYLGPEAIAT
jgi:anti-sigma regulatory factor (Ser/Thr protein kinase)